MIDEPVTAFGRLSLPTNGAAVDVVADILTVLSFTKGNAEPSQRYDLTVADSDLVATMKQNAEKGEIVIVQGVLNKDKTAIAVTNCIDSRGHNGSVIPYGRLTLPTNGTADDVVAVLHFTEEGAAPSVQHNLTVADSTLAASIKRNAEKGNVVIVQGVFNKDESAIAVTKLIAEGRKFGPTAK